MLRWTSRQRNKRSLLLPRGSVNWRTPRTSRPGNIASSLDPSVEGALSARFDPGQPPRTRGTVKLGAPLCPPTCNAIEAVHCRRGQMTREMRIVQLRRVQRPSRAEESREYLTRDLPGRRCAEPRGRPQPQ